MTEETKKPGKTISILLGEFRESLVKLVNESGLPIGITFMVVHELHNELEKVAQAQYEQELAAYNAELQKENK